jgi:hypothetical protein
MWWLHYGERCHFFFAVISSGSLEIWNILKKLSWIRWWKASLQM